MKERLVDGAYAAGWAGLRHLPEPVARGLFNLIADIAWRREGKGVRQLEANLARVHPDADAARLRELSRAGMRSYLRYWMESFRLPTWSLDRIAAAMPVKGLEPLHEAMAAGRGAILALPHMGNWDLAGAWIASAGGYPFTTVAERLKPESLFDRFVAYREGLGMEVLALTGSDISVVGTLARRLREGKLVCLVGDRDLSEQGVPVDFFGEQTRMPAGPAALAVRTGAALFPVTLWYDGPVMHAEVHPEVAPPTGDDKSEQAAAMTQAMADVWAEGIREHSVDWHMLQKLWLSDLTPRGPQQ
ncbi:phosphatidylinositol mannoside acyltransferase [Kitasatospora paracochleata]|uniref:KDO2-lipid IV(A) lauroyltransferase n=1 Tax=Kitasatospora paracochleata TaxID=58354 RepID=A0ABT1IUP6_9ACTN|nr:phosphatidylinositol mannoside acyltransferase [Kitasatospora paracochleata]MCP2308845.1 KDO2-lipid IV(A) lauroyltransferase [Kitasatospora paracochleata]MCP2308868.1 KDO2-lipid IV(A) lauroyltransferase [Kitasatospora paracochleata]